MGALTEYQVMTKEVEQRLFTKAVEWIKENDVEEQDVAIFAQHVGMKVCGDCKEKRDGIRIDGALSSFGNTDREGDVVMEGAFDESIKQIKKLGKLPMLKDHVADTDSQIGSFDSVKVNGGLLAVSGFISKTKQSEHIIKLIEDGHLDTLSMGGLFKFAKSGERDKKGRRYIEKVVLFEGSVVVVPANPKATFTQKSLTQDVENAEQVEEPTGHTSNEKQVSKTQREKVIDAIRILKGGN